MNLVRALLLLMLLPFSAQAITITLTESTANVFAGTWSIGPLNLVDGVYQHERPTRLRVGTDEDGFSISMSEAVTNEPETADHVIYRIILSGWTGSDAGSVIMDYYGDGLGNWLYDQYLSDDIAVNVFGTFNAQDGSWTGTFSVTKNVPEGGGLACLLIGLAGCVAGRRFRRVS